MTINNPLHRIVEQVADCFADSGYAFVEQDKIDGLAIVLDSFLTEAGIPVENPFRGTSKPLTSVERQRGIPERGIN